MSNIARVAGQAANTLSKPLDITDVFSTYLYTGTNATQTITNGIDLAGEGGLVWLKNRNTVSSHSLHDTERTPSYQLVSNSTAAEDTLYGDLTSFNSNGFSLGTGGGGNNIANTSAIASWTFRKAPKFFDVVTYTGTGSAQTISHNLESVPGMIVVKKTNGTGDWLVYHRHAHIGQTYQPLPERKYLNLNDNGSVSHGTGLMWGDTPPTDTAFSVSTDTQSNNNGDTYVAYLFAHNDGDGGFGPNGDADIIKCGSYTGNGSTTGPTVDLGFEPQWVLVKRTDSTGNWLLQDNMRSLSLTNTDMLFPNLSNAATTGAYPSVVPTATGFYIGDNGTNYNANGGTYIYMAIRRGPLAVPEDATEVFQSFLRTGTSSPTTITGLDLTPDLILPTARNTSAYPTAVIDRLRGPALTGGLMRTFSTAAESTESGITGFDVQNGFEMGSGPYGNNAGKTYVFHLWKRAPGFFDVVAYKGQDTLGAAIPHNLGVAPELIIIKSRNAARDWMVALPLVGPDGRAQSLSLNLSSAVRNERMFPSGGSLPDENNFYLASENSVNTSSDNYIAYLFASAPGVSKVGSYTGNGSSQTIDCGFTSGARFVLIKRTDSTGHWYVWDTERGIVTGNDPYIRYNWVANEVTSDDSIDPDNSGFIVNQVAATDINVSSADYIFYAIA